jgi:hypothetical protein
MFEQIVTPEHLEVFQQGSPDNTRIPIRLQWRFKGEQRVQYQITAVSTPNLNQTLNWPNDWIDLDGLHQKGKGRSEFAAKIELVKPGWYALRIRILKRLDKYQVLRTVIFGLGEVFITAGQSNSANSGQVRMSPNSPHVMAKAKKGWRLAHDPQPLSNGTGGSPWPVMGDYLAARVQVPIGIISVGIGGTAVRQWLPENRDCYPGLQHVLHYLSRHQTDVRAILWHQGESDTIEKTISEKYRRQLETVIYSSWRDAGRQIPWLIAQVSFHPDMTDQQYARNIIDAQRQIVQSPWILAGPTTDDMLGPAWRYDNVHFNRDGLVEHGKRWAKLIERYFFSQ